MKVHLRKVRDHYDTVLDFTQSRFSSDEIVKQVAQNLTDCKNITTVTIYNCDLYEKGAQALEEAIVNHPALKTLVLIGIRVCSYPVQTLDEYFFPKDLDLAVKHLCKIFSNANLNYIELANLSFFDHTERVYEHFDMVDPSVMRDLLSEEKEPQYREQILESLNHNSTLLGLVYLTENIMILNAVEEIEKNIQMRHRAENMNEVFQGTHAAIETHMLPKMYDLFKPNIWNKTQ